MKIKMLLSTYWILIIIMIAVDALLGMPFLALGGFIIGGIIITTIYIISEYKK